MGKKAQAGSAEKRPRKKADLTALEEKIADLEKELGAVRAEAEDASDRALRMLAEFDNYRKRARRERDEAQGVGAAAVLRETLVLADDLDRALEHAGDGVPQAFLDGMRLVARGLHDLLDRHGVSRIEAEGHPFDPNVHEALSSAPAEDAEPNTVLREVQAGYRMGERVLRPSKVVVALAPPVEEAAAGDEPGAED